MYIAHFQYFTENKSEAGKADTDLFVIIVVSAIILIFFVFIILFVFLIRIEGNHLNMMKALLGQQGHEFLTLTLVHVNHDRPGHPFDRIFAALANQPVILPLMRTDLEFQHKPVIDSDIEDSELGPDPLRYLD